MLPYDMFDVTRSAEEARRADRLANIYHKGQELGWVGRDVLAGLIEKHGGIHMEERPRQALSQIFSILMWGELAAWRISAQLADRLEPLEAKMAATSQAFDEARHFYVLHDYLVALGHVPKRPDPQTEAVLNAVLATDSIPQKIIGMHLLIENIALTMFHFIKILQIEPVLTELLPYYERDEARHVGFGMQELPTQLKKMGRREGILLLAFQARIISHVLRSLKTLEPNLRVLGLSPRQVLEDGTAKVEKTIDLILAEGRLPRGAGGEAVRRSVAAACEIAFPEGEVPLPRRLALALQALRQERAA